MARHGSSRRAFTLFELLLLLLLNMLLNFECQSKLVNLYSKFGVFGMVFHRITFSWIQFFCDKNTSFLYDSHSQSETCFESPSHAPSAAVVANINFVAHQKSLLARLSCPVAGGPAKVRH